MRFKKCSFKSQLQTPTWSKSCSRFKDVYLRAKGANTINVNGLAGTPSVPFRILVLMSGGGWGVCCDVRVLEKFSVDRVLSTWVWVKDHGDANSGLQVYCHIGLLRDEGESFTGNLTGGKSSKDMQLTCDDQVRKVLTWIVLTGELVANSEAKGTLVLIHKK